MQRTPNLTELDKKIICELQENIPITSRPFEKMAKKLGISELELLDKIKFYKKKGYLRRFGAALRHREMGLNANPMIAMRVSNEKIQDAGKKVASFPQVTHCYHRLPQPEFPYNLYAMIHCSTKKECDELAKKIISSIDVEDYSLLYSTQELKKTSMKYFKDE